MGVGVGGGGGGGGGVVANNAIHHDHCNMQ